MSDSGLNYLHDLTYEKIIEASPYSYILINQAGIIVFVNRTIEKLLGYQVEDVVGQPIENLIPEEYRSSHIELRNHFVIEPVARRMATGRILSALKKDGSHLPIEIGLNPIEIEGAKYTLATLIDITESSVHQHEMKKARERFALAADASSIGIWEWDIVNNILIWDEAMYRIYGVNKEDFSGAYDAWASGLHHDDLKKAEEDLGAALEGSKSFNTEFRIIWPSDNSVHNIRGRAIVERDKKGKAVKITGTNWDVTEENHKREQLKQAVVALANKNKELEQFAYIASHDLQEPLRSILSLIEMMEVENIQNMNDDQKQACEFIKESTQRMQLLIKHLLDFNRLGTKSNLQETDCNQLVNSVIEDLSSLVANSNANIIVDPLPTIPAFQTELRLLFQNLISNAIKFRNPDVKPSIRIGAHKYNDGWDFTVQDNGIGIDPKYHVKIFVIFQRLHSNQKYKGSGIGLAHCKKIVSMHNGEIWLKSIPKKGSIFHFTINPKA